ncbi:hypothetical protein Skr01_08170 [Sphaerisporangium krabiense]|uniref:Uncharacterized protein n=1 Tax=Sphaerisporangium krabiense TaxID=763782 RepID=A0A7W9DVC3_9ACTN|nr:hypothetical protein [Sphaerisporangium krabiense]MBB5631315.1 hypothetical protein [Sphaerisporangium krabiense]GII60732.1 hypothetical protein Skr01_08170 [Sphaerisporangium krabiense]
MSTLAALARLRAVRTGTAQRLATVRHCHLSERPMVFVPLRLAGEAAAPLAAMAGTDPDHPRLLVVPQPRDRDLRFAFAAELAEIVLPYVESLQKETETVERRGAEPYERCADAPQILVPNRGAVAFTQLLGRSTRFRRAEGPHAVHPSVPILGRWLTFFAQRARHPGSALLLAATEALSLHWATGQSALEDANLASLAAWIDPPPGMSGARAAREAEDPLVCPPAGPVTDPGFDAEVLAPAIRAYEEAPGPRTAGRVTEAVRTQLEPTWRLMWRAVELLRALPESRGAATRWEGDRGAFTAFTEQLAEGGPPQPKHDGAVAAASRLARMERAQASYDAQRAYDDPLVMASYRLTGEAFTGTVTEADPSHAEGEGRGRKLRPLITVRTQDPVRLAAGAKLGTPDRRGQQAEVVAAEDGLVTLKIVKGMGRGKTATPGAVPEVGETVCYAALSEEFQPPASLPAPEDTPWTHGGPPPEYVPSAEDDREEWS